jgi:alanine-synthesizing transaminase
MRNNLIKSGADQLSYEIREIVEVAHKIEAMGVEITWENIGDPIQKGLQMPLWIRQIVSDTTLNDLSSYGYSPTKGLLTTRQFLADLASSQTYRLDSEDILFFNGLGDAISHIYSALDATVRVIGPNPAYSTHSSAEASHASAPHITYRLDPLNNWLPDLQDLERKIQDDPGISGILIINPDNPTGMVYPEDTLRKIVKLAKTYGLFIIADEVYRKVAYGAPMVNLIDVIDDVPGLALKGLSKEIPWPGARCGWIEFYNSKQDSNFAGYVKSLIDAKRLEVCATTLPQTVLPKIISDSRYQAMLDANNARYNARALAAHDAFSDIDGVNCIKPNGALYATITFDNEALNDKQSLDIANADARDYILPLIEKSSLDKRFVYYLLASTGICVVPLSGFNSDIPGFRMTLLETNEQKYRQTLDTIALAIKQYLK